MYKKDPETGQLVYRETNPKLNGFARATKKSIKKREKSVAKLLRKVEHADHILNPEHAQHERMKKLQEKLEGREQKLREIAVARGVRPVRRAARKAYRGQIAAAWRGETDKELGKRERFYDDLGRALERDEQMTERIDLGRPGRIRDLAALVGATREKDALDEHGSAGEADKAQEQKQKMEARAARYRSRDFSVRKRRRNNQEKLIKRQNKQVQRYQELRAAKQRLADLQRPQP